MEVTTLLKSARNAAENPRGTLTGKCLIFGRKGNKLTLPSLKPMTERVPICAAKCQRELPAGARQ